MRLIDKIMIAREAVDITKIDQEITRTSGASTASGIFKPSSSSTSTWSKPKDPRIVRVSRAFGGKDRHSKVFTVRGLRDRRIRLSVPTAVQLYDLQERLGLNQPSKVVDWLLNAAKHEIDQLPPLQIPQGVLFRHDLLPSGSNFFELGAGNSQSDKPDHDVKISANWTDQLVKRPESDSLLGKSKNLLSCENWTRNDEERELINIRSQGAYDHPGLPSFLDSTTSQYNPFVRWEYPSHLTLSQPARTREVTDRVAPEDMNNLSFVQVPSAFCAQSGPHQILVHQPAEMNFPLSMSGFDPRQVNYQTSMLSDSSLITSSTVHVSSTSQSICQAIPFHHGSSSRHSPFSKHHSK